MWPLVLALALSPVVEQAAPTVAVVDLSTRPAPAVADAIRKLPELKGRALSSSRTAAVVADAAGLGLVCRIDEDACLQKLVVLARVDEIVAFAVDGDEVSIARVEGADHDVERGNVRVAGSAATRARKAWEALSSSSEETAPEEHAPPDEEPPAPDVERKDLPPLDEGEPHEPPHAETSGGGISVPFVVTASGAVGAVGFGVAAVMVSAALANDLRNADRGVTLPDSYYDAQTAFFALGALTGASVLVGGAGAVWLVLSGAGSPGE
jgi:hypothetical protein